MGGAVTGTTGVSVLQTSPEELRRAARVLRGVGADLADLGARAASAAPSRDGWAGVAALEQQARLSSLRRLVELTSLPGAEVATVLDRCADVAEGCTVRVLTWRRRVEELTAELTGLRLQGPPPEPVLEVAWRRRVAELEEEVARARRFIDEAEAEFDDAQQWASRVVLGAWSVVEAVHRVVGYAKGVRTAARRIPWAVVHTVRTSQMVVALSRARWAKEAAVRAAALRRGQEILQGLIVQLSPPRGAGRALGTGRFAPGPVGLILAWVTAWSDLRTGGGYEGWRGGITRVLATGALVGGPLTLVGLFPPLVAVAPVGISLIGLYQGWILGNVVWDGVTVGMRYVRLARRALPGLRRAGVRLAAEAGLRAGWALRDLRTRTLVRSTQLALELEDRVDDVGEHVGRIADPLRDPRRWVVGLPGGRAPGLPIRDVLDEVVERLPGTASLRERIRQVGLPLRLPGSPLGPVLRAPVDLGARP